MFLSYFVVRAAGGRRLQPGCGGPAHPTTFHAWAPCTECGEGRMVGVTTGRLKGAKGSPWPECAMTPRCKGRHTPTPADLELAARRQRPRRGAAGRGGRAR